MSSPSVAMTVGGLFSSPQARKLLGNRLFVLGAILFGAMVFLAVAGPAISPFDPNENNFRERFESPSLKHLFGTDAYGRDLFSRVLSGTGLSLRIGLFVVIFNGILGTIVGASAGYFRRLDNPLMRVMDGLMAFPGILLAIALAAALGPSEFNAVLALTIAYAPRTARVVRASVLVVREMEYVEAARAVGAKHLRILVRHILPNCLSPLIVQLTFIFAVAIIAEAVLSFIGVGPPPPAPTLGNVIAEGRNYIPEAPWISIFPGIVISLAVLGLNLLGDGLRDILDPRMRAIVR